MRNAAAVAAGTEIGKRAKAVMDAGGLVGDKIVIGIIADRIAQVYCKFDLFARVPLAQLGRHKCERGPMHMTTIYIFLAG